MIIPCILGVIIICHRDGKCFWMVNRKMQKQKPKTFNKTKRAIYGQLKSLLFSTTSDSNGALIKAQMLSDVQVKASFSHLCRGPAGLQDAPVWIKYRKHSLCSAELWEGTPFWTKQKMNYFSKRTISKGHQHLVNKWIACTFAQGLLSLWKHHLDPTPAPRLGIFTQLCNQCICKQTRSLKAHAVRQRHQQSTSKHTGLSNRNLPAKFSTEWVITILSQMPKRTHTENKQFGAS